MKTVRRLFVLNGTAYDGKDRIGKPTVPVLDRTNGTAKTNGTVRAINTNRPYFECLIMMQHCTARFIETNYSYPLAYTWIYPFWSNL